MSLINQVLKDLEKRHANADAGALARAVRPLPDERSRRTLWIGLTIMVIAAVTVSGAWWWTKRADAFALFVSDKPAAQQVAAPAPVVRGRTAVRSRQDGTSGDRRASASTSR